MCCGMRQVQILKKQTAQGKDREGGIDRNLSEVRNVLAGMGICSDMGNGRMGKQDQGYRRRISVRSFVRTARSMRRERVRAYFSSSLSRSRLKDSSQPTSTRMRMPLSNSRSDW